jgi:apolipoprotein N-acyltransferase
LNPLSVPYSAAALTQVSAAFSAPIVTGTITKDSQGTYFNSSLVWVAGKGATAQFDKIHPVPFAEYMPDRPFWRALAPDLVDLVGYDYGLGTRPNVVNVNGVSVGLSICFDISYEQQARAFIAGGAQVVFAQTNNADFGRTDENVQQLAIARLRAVETGRAVVNISTVGTSAIIDSSGSTIAQIPAYEPGAMLESIPLYDNITPAMALGQLYEILLTVVALAGLLMLITWRRKP